MAKIKKLSKKTRLGIIVSLVSIMMLFLVTPSAATDVRIGVGGQTMVYRGEPLDFWVQIDIYSGEQVPIDYICVDMSGAGSAYVKFNPNGDIIDQTEGEPFSILSHSFPAMGYGYTYCEENWGYGYIHAGYNPYGYLCPCGEEGFDEYLPRGYALEAKGYGYHLGPGYGYGYGEEGYHGECYPGVVSLKYNIRLNTANMPYGTYYANATTGTPESNKGYGALALAEGLPREILENLGLISCGFTSETPYQFLIGAYGGGGGGGGGGEAAAPELGRVTYTCSSLDKCVFDLTYIIGRDGRTIRDIVFYFEGLGVSFVIPAGTLLVGPDGKPLLQLILTLLHTPPVPEGWAMVGNAVDFAPSGTTFTPAITMIWNYHQADVPDDASEADIVAAYWDGAQWINLKTTVDTTANTATASLSHFTPFALLAKVSPAAPPLEEAPPTAPPEAPVEEAPPAAPIAWWIWVIAGVVVASIVVWLIVRRRAA